MMMLGIHSENVRLGRSSEVAHWSFSPNITSKVNWCLFLFADNLSSGHRNWTVNKYLFHFVTKLKLKCLCSHIFSRLLSESVA